MKFAKNLLAAGVSVAALFVGQSANAISYGTDVSSSDYQDWIVHIKVTNASGGYNVCGGALVGTKYILTAAHCVGDIVNSSPRTYNYFVDQDADNTITVTNAVSASDTDHSYDRTYSITELGDTDTMYAAYDSVYTALSADVDSSLQLSEASESDFNIYANRDLVLLTLNEEIPHSTQAILTPMIDVDSASANVPYGADITVQGWGANENGSLQDTLQVTTEQNDMFQKTVSKVFGETNSGDEVDCAVGTADDCTLWYRDYVEISANSTTGALALSGDSGTPLVYNGRYIGNLSTVSTTENYNTFTFLDYYMDQIRDAINSVVYPTSVDHAVSSGSTSTFTISVPVQNFTSSSVALYPSLSTDSSVISASIGGTCEGATLSTEEGCTVTITVDSDNTAITSAQTATLSLNDDSDTTIPISVSIASTSSSSSDSSDSGSSGGGSFGIWSLLFMAVPALRRFKSNK